MHDATNRPQRMLYSFEARCRAISAMLAGMSPAKAAASVGASRASGYRWLTRYRAGGWAGLRERPSTPKHQPRRLSPAAEAEIVAARERSGAGPLTLGAMLGRPASTVGKVLRRLGRSRLPREPRPPVVRYERDRPGELLHIDTKKLGRFWHVGKRILGDGVTRSPGAGWQHVHVAVDDHSRLAYAEVLPTDRRHDALAFLEQALAAFGRRGVRVRRVLTDNAKAYTVSRDFRDAAAAWGVELRNTRPYRPQTNGKAERFIQILQHEWAYARPYRSNTERLDALPRWLYRYNHRRLHGGIGAAVPASRL